MRKEMVFQFDKEAIKEMYWNIYIILSPPRAASTAFSRVFWEHPSVGFYSFEPFETTYFWNDSLNVVYQKLRHPLDVRPLKKHSNGAEKSLVIKEMPYQVGRNFPLLMDLTSKPLIVLIRDPRLTISSRMRRRKERGDNPLFPLAETGWDLLESQVHYLREKSLPYMVVDATDFRNEPYSIMGQVFDNLELPFSESMLQWKPAAETDIDNLRGRHRNQYERALLSQGVEPPCEQIPDLEWFPEEGGFRDHLPRAMDIYRRLQESPYRIYSLANR